MIAPDHKPLFYFEPFTLVSCLLTLFILYLQFFKCLRTTIRCQYKLQRVSRYPTSPEPRAENSALPKTSTGLRIKLKRPPKQTVSPPTTSAEDLDHWHRKVCTVVIQPPLIAHAILYFFHNVHNIIYLKTTNRGILVTLWSKVQILSNFF